MSEARCECCGVPDAGTRCRECALPCDGLHGDQLQLVLMRAVHDGRLAPYVALARSMYDDAMLTGRMIIRPCAHHPGGHATIPNPPKRWEVVVARALCRNELPDISLVLGAVLAKYIPGRCSRRTLDAIADDMREALSAVDPSIVHVEVDSKIDVVDPQHLQIVITGEAPVLGAVVTPPGVADVAIPADIMLRKRAQA